MLISATPSSTTAHATANPAAAAAAIEQRLSPAALEPVARVERGGPRYSGRRVQPFTSEREEEAPSSQAVDRRGPDRHFGAGGLTASPYGRPSAQFLAQYIGQAFEPGGDVNANEGLAGHRAYADAAGRGTTFLGFDDPIDFSV